MKAEQDLQILAESLVVQVLYYKLLITFVLITNNTIITRYNETEK